MSPLSPRGLGRRTTPEDAALVREDSARINQLLQIQSPQPLDLVDAARLLMRYQGLPAMESMCQALQGHLARWELDRDGLNAATRSLWASGWRPPLNGAASEPVGSGADVNSV